MHMFLIQCKGLRDLRLTVTKKAPSSLWGHQAKHVYGKQKKLGWETAPGLQYVEYIKCCLDQICISATYVSGSGTSQRTKQL